MIKIVEIEVQRFRSILNLKVSIDDSSNIIICGQNNVGKTNLLRAINIFFNPDLYIPATDIPTIKHATGGGAIHPKVVLTFYDTDANTSFVLSRNFANWSIQESVGFSGYKFLGKKYKAVNKVNITNEEILNFMSQINFYNISSINTIVPNVIDGISEDLITGEFENTRFGKGKAALRDAYNEYVDGLQEILDQFAVSVSDVFNQFRDNWNVKFVVPKNSNSFRELISDDVQLKIDDRGTLGIEDKGSGLQRLAIILLQFELGKRLRKNKSNIYCIDEPDIYLHEGLQRKLKKFFDDKAEDSQIIYTTHSNVFINPYNIRNIIMLNAELYEQFSSRKKKIINVIETKLVDINNDEGYELICRHLGIERAEYKILEKRNFLVEGNCDKHYIVEMLRFFGLEDVNIESSNGSNNMVKFLEFYEGYYKNTSGYVPQVIVIYDNDSKGRETYKSLKTRNFNYIKVKHYLLPNCLGNSDFSLDHNTTNNEIEDFLYPEILCYLINELLKKKNMNAINPKIICKKIQTNAFKKDGILKLCEHYKNESNPERGNEISFISSGQATNQIKEGLAGMFKIKGNKNLLRLLEENNTKYPTVEISLRELIAMFNDEEINN